MPVKIVYCRLLINMIGRVILLSKIMKQLIVVLFVAVTTVSFAQHKGVDTYFSQLRSNKSPNLPTEVYKPEHAKTILNALPVYLQDTVVIIRSKATLIARVVGTRSTLAPIRQQAVTQVIQAANDKSTGNAGAALTYLTEFKKTSILRRVSRLGDSVGNGVYFSAESLRRHNRYMKPMC